MNLIEFLSERIDDDAEIARYAGGRSWHATMSGIDDDEGEEILYVDDGPGLTRGKSHVVRHDPARVLAECEAKRRIVGMVIPDAWSDDGQPLGGGYVEAWWDAIKFLALPYETHPDYCEEWRL